jgi:pimeloyl-ACP methyl ester carboxylesterase
MSSASATPTPDLDDQLRAQATRLQTPCGDGFVTWHRWGPADGGGKPAIVLFHGGSGSWTHWVRNIGPLAAAGRQVLVPDLPGFGDSAKPPKGSDADAVAPVLAQGLQELLHGTPCDLVGFSFGGMTAGLLAAGAPALVARLVVVGAPALGLASRRTVVLHPWRHLKEESQREEVHRFNLASLMVYHPETIDALALKTHTANVVRDRMLGRRLAYTDVLKQALLKLTCPVRAIYGAEDALYRGRTDVLESALNEIPAFRELTLIPDAGHWVQYEAADAFNATLLAALAAE